MLGDLIGEVQGQDKLDGIVGVLGFGTDAGGKSSGKFYAGE
ncbi:hypothetical protein [Streptomyces sp. CBMA123]|nr:hypothetical protein [Streptomyces sp. CBMA123]